MKNMHKIRGKREFLFDDRELLVLGSGAIIICLLIFVLGFLVGQGLQQNTLAQSMTSPQEVNDEPFIRDTTASVTPSETSPLIEETKTAPASVTEKKSQSSYFTVIPDRQEYVEVEATPVNPDTPLTVPQKPDVPEAVVTEPPSQSPVEEPVTQPAPSASTPLHQQTIVAPALPNVPSSPTDEMHIGRPTVGISESAGLNGPIFSVQVASSPSQEDSERLQQQFIALGYESQVMKADLGARGIWYRVRVGNLATKEEAERMRQDILNRASHLARDPYVIEVD